MALSKGYVTRQDIREARALREATKQYIIRKFLEDRGDPRVFQESKEEWGGKFVPVTSDLPRVRRAQDICSKQIKDWFRFAVFPRAHATVHLFHAHRCMDRSKTSFPCTHVVTSIRDFEHFNLHMSTPQC